MTAQPSTNPEPREAEGLVRPYLATAICFVMAVLAWGTVFYGHSIYMNALMREHGWSSSLVSSAILVFWIASLPGTLTVGVLIDRYGPPSVVMIGGVCIGTGLALLGHIREPWQMFAIYAAMGFGYPAMAAAAISATLAPWFEKGFGVSLGIALTGASVGGAILPPLVVQNSSVHGFAATMTIIGGAVLAIILIAVALLLVIGQPKKAKSSSPDGTHYSMSAIICQWRFWAIAVPAALGLGGQVGFLAHQIPIIATETGTVKAAFMVTVVAIASAFGRLFIGLLSRYVSVTTLAALCYLLFGAGVALLASAKSELAIFASCALAGLTVGGIVMLPPLIVRHAYGIHGFGRTYALVNVVMYILAGLSPWFVGILRDTNGTYTAALYMLAAMEVIAAALILLASSTIASAKR